MYSIIYIIICEILQRCYPYFGDMRYLDFSTPQWVMRRISFEVFISVGYVGGGNEGGRNESGGSGSAVECWWGEGENSVKRAIMQVWCVMDIFTFLIHKYHNIDGL